MKKNTALILVFIGLFGCTSEAELTGTYYKSEKDFIIFKPNQKMAISQGNGLEEYAYSRKDNVITLTDSRFATPLDFVIQDDGSVTFMTNKFVKK